MRRVLMALTIGCVAIVAVAAILHSFFGLRVQLYGGGVPRLAFIPDVEAHATAIARHREAQRLEAPVADAPIEQALTASETVLAQPAGAAAPSTAPAPAPATAYWTDFRGPLRDGRYDERRIVTAWPSAGLTPVWKQPVGGGHASFVVARGRAFTIEQRGQQEVAAAYEVATGREIWTTEWTARFVEYYGGDGPRATPTWADGIVYALGGTGELRALEEATGQTIWRANILEDNGARNLEWGMAASPLVVDDTVVVLPGGSNGRSVVAYDRRTGKRVWSTLDDQQAYSSPMLVTLGGVRQIVVFSARRLMGLTPDRGELLWDYAWRTDFDVNASQPLVIGENRVFVSTGYGTGAAVIELARSGDGFSVREIWRNNRMKNQFTSSVLHDGIVYGLDDSILAAVDAATGEQRWKGGRYGYGQVMLADGHLIVATEDGELAIVRATPGRHEELVRFPALQGRTWNHPAMADGYLLVRNGGEMAAFDLRSSGETR